ncbi:ribosome-associated ATPase/putative transporter RbbA (plasmid) [Azospirillum oryzae]|uniref:Ribosome-associated ATPase/putative transporter RbbA n=1 Tax=Azospirillum oryzae TaxID=286727 RepID=A0A6N1AFX0_9PROT|nr:ribosome-associated ATPase/putative transporter RbbA [Azospirillum oryzae]KAA0588670.1 ribosome-associated ATPase/putative transporter RbbA [Azospirillum oryzae]QKS50018.1 ribosome-associated ATPase/putative transporter RbbA [Azospirillum oryzae]GLR82464.1 multidrug ABC transporter ATP-binding protein [Azospirillum oryzae]
MTPAPAVSLSGVRHRYGGTVALEDASLDIPAGTSVAVIGPDGVGKSTLLGLISTAKKIQRGSIRVLGTDVSDRHGRAALQPRIAYMPQGLGRNLYAELSVAENLQFFGRLFGLDAAERRRRIADLLESTGLAPFPDRPAGKLSGGMKQKLGLCCALLHDPDLLILDEPTTGVDPLSRRQFWDLIARIRAGRAGMTVLVATSYMDEAERFDRVVMMNGGRLLAHDTPAAVKAQTGAADLEEAFVALLPEDAKRGHERLTVPPRPPEPAGAAPAIEAIGLTRRFGDFTAVSDISFRIGRGEIFGFLGSNGCGKTTTMKMLTGLLPASAGEARLFGKPVDATDLESRRRVGYMAQAFSLYGELTVRQNLDLHARLFDLPDAETRLAALVERFGLSPYIDAVADRLPLGVRQRLSLAVAILHGPELLILDEPTSGVDPVARDQFWRDLIALSRDQGVTIFVSTHFMNEAARCDRVAFMNAGRVIAAGPPDELRRQQQADSLDDAFIGFMELAEGEEPDENRPLPPREREETHEVGRVRGNARIPNRTASCPTPHPSHAPHGPLPSPGTGEGVSPLSRRRLLAYAWRETLELRRDPVRLTVALLGTVLLMLVFGFGITMDVENLTFAVLDHDRSPESRAYIEQFDGSRSFRATPPAVDARDLALRLQRGEASLTIEIPEGFGRDLRRGRIPEIAVRIDGAMPFRAETIQGYVSGLHQRFIQDTALAAGATLPAAPATLEMRYRYNQAFRSLDAMVPATIGLLLVFIPAILAALGVVREKELGSITNLYVTPVTRLEFLLGKQLPYIGLAAFNLLLMVAMAVTLFGVPVKGSLIGLLLGGLVYVVATTALGLLISVFTATQTAAVFGTAIVTMLPATQFSGMLQPVATLEGGAWLFGTLFPTTHFLKISVGAFTKGLAFPELLPFILATAAFVPVFLALGVAFLPKQER